MRLDEIYLRYRDNIDFYLVYIQEIHPTDGWQILTNLTDEILYEQPTSLDERAEMAGLCLLNLNLKMPTLLDDMDNGTDHKYAALPERLYVLDAEGRIAYRSAMGPWGFDVDAWTDAIAAQVAKT